MIVRCPRCDQPIDEEDLAYAKRVGISTIGCYKDCEPVDWRAECMRLRKALEVYADPRNWGRAKNEWQLDRRGWIEAEAALRGKTTS